MLGLLSIVPVLALIIGIMSMHVCALQVAIPAVVDPALSLSTLSLLPPLQLSQALAGAAQSGFQPPHTWQAGMMEYTLQQLSGLSGDEMPILAALVWAVSELGIAPSQPWLHVAAAKMQQGVEAQSFLAPDLCQTVAALGAMGYKPDAMAAVALLKEVQLQVSTKQGFLGFIFLRTHFGRLDALQRATLTDCAHICTWHLLRAFLLF